eukprot:gene9964-6956_t
MARRGAVWSTILSLCRRGGEKDISCRTDREMCNRIREWVIHCCAVVSWYFLRLRQLLPLITVDDAKPLDIYHNCFLRFRSSVSFVVCLLVCKYVYIYIALLVLYLSSPCPVIEIFSSAHPYGGDIYTSEAVLHRKRWRLTLSHTPFTTEMMGIKVKQKGKRSSTPVLPNDADPIDLLKGVI